MSIDEAREILGGEVEHDEHPSGRACGVCGVPMQIWWSDAQRAQHQLYHQAIAAAFGVIAGAR